VSPGYANCYAETLSRRNPAVLGQWGRGKPRVLAKNWTDPVRWNRAWNKAQYFTRVQGQPEPAKPTVFPSLCDWLDDEVPVEWLAKFLKLIHDTPNLTWLLLTKRPESFKNLIREAESFLLHEYGTGNPDAWGMVNRWILGDAPRNVWVGTSVEDQTRADERIPALLKIPAVSRFLSAEPLLDWVNLRLPNRSFGFPQHITKEGHAVGMPQGIHWVIIGGESGHGARQCNVEAIRSLVVQCKRAGVPAFVKQLGAVPIQGNRSVIRDPIFGYPNRRVPGITHPKGGDPAEWPEDLRVREFPEGLR